MAVTPKKLHLKGMEIQANFNGHGSSQNGLDLELVFTENNLTYGTPCISPKLSIAVSQMTSVSYSDEGCLNISYETHEFLEGARYESVCKTIQFFCWSEDPTADGNELRNFLKMHWTLFSNKRKLKVKTFLGTECRLAWIYENLSKLSKEDLKRELEPYHIWNVPNEILQFPYYDDYSLYRKEKQYEDDFKQFLLYDQFNHFKLREPLLQDSEGKCYSNVLHFVEQFRKSIPQTLPENAQDQIWIRILKKVKQAMSPRILDQITDPNPFDVIDGKLKRAIEHSNANQESMKEMDQPKDKERYAMSRVANCLRVQSCT